MPQIQIKSFTSPRTPAELPLVDQLNQFFAGNVRMTVLKVDLASEEGSARGRQLTITLTLDVGPAFVPSLAPTPAEEAAAGGVVYGVAEFIATTLQTVDAQASIFLAANPALIPIRSLNVQSPESRFISRPRLLVFYAQVPYLTSGRDTLKMSGLAPVSVQPGHSATSVDGTDDARVRLPEVRNLSIQPWARAGTALVVKSVNGGGSPAFAAIGPNLVAPGQPVIPASPPPALEDAPLCNSCYRLVSAQFVPGTLPCPITPNIAWDYVSCRRGDLVDIVKASGSGFTTVGGAAPGLGCACNAIEQPWVWLDPDHYSYEIQTADCGSFIASVGFEALDPACGAGTFTDAIWVLSYERCSSESSASCTTAPPNPAVPLLPPGAPVVPPPAPPVPTGRCSFTYTITCSLGLWTLTSAEANGCTADCVSDDDWVGDSCTRTYTVCGDVCDL
jgi:hypothetical protein